MKYITPASWLLSRSPGGSIWGIVRLSAEDTIAVLERLLVDKKLASLTPEDRQLFGWICGIHCANCTHSPVALVTRRENASN